MPFHVLSLHTANVISAVESLSKKEDGADAAKKGPPSPATQLDLRALEHRLLTFTEQV
jgi:hypothetical protein